MVTVFYISAVIAVLATVMVVTRRSAVHALLYLILSLLAAAVIFYTLGAPFVAALEVIIYAGAIMVLFIFVVMMLDLSHDATERERRHLQPRNWILPSLLGVALLAEIVYMLSRSGGSAAGEVGPRRVGAAMFGPYLIAVELASLLLMAGLVGAYHLGRKDAPEEVPPKEGA